LLVEQRVEYPARARLPEQTARDAVHATLAAHVFAEDQQLGMFHQQVAERAIDRQRQSERPFCRAETNQNTAGARGQKTLRFRASGNMYPFDQSRC
jgi:hypothetical protein